MNRPNRKSFGLISPKLKNKMWENAHVSKLRLNLNATYDRNLPNCSDLKFYSNRWQFWHYFNVMIFVYRISVKQIKLEICNKQQKLRTLFKCNLIHFSRVTVNACRNFRSEGFQIAIKPVLFRKCGLFHIAVLTLCQNDGKYIRKISLLNVALGVGKPQKQCRNKMCLALHSVQEKCLNGSSLERSLSDRETGRRPGSALLHDCSAEYTFFLLNQLKSDWIYIFPIGFEPNGIPFGSKSIGES